MTHDDQRTTEESNANDGGPSATRRGVLAGAAGLAGAAAVPAFSAPAAAAAPLDGGATLYDGLTLARDSVYDYAPSVMYGDGDRIKMWWCGQDDAGDAVYYSELTSTGWTTPQRVLAASSGDWDSAHACDPSVVKGNFTADGSSWDYAMYYGGTTDSGGTNTHIGVAFSNDGVSWHKYSGNPVIHPSSDPASSYGAGMPTVYRHPAYEDTVTVAFYDDTSSPNNHYVTASDAVSFGSRTDLTADPRTDDAIGDVAYFPDDGVWYVTTKNMNDEVIYLYKTSTDDLNSTWEKCGEVHATLTGNGANHNPGWMRLPNGDLREEATSQYKYVYFGTGAPRPDTHTWDIGQVRYVDGWEFDQDGDREGWTSYNVCCESGEPTNGTWVTTADQSDPQWVSPELAAEAAATSTVVVNLANQNADTSGRVFFERAVDSGFHQDRSVGFTVQNDGSWDEYRVDMSSNDYWTGTVTRLRIDPIRDGTGDPLGIDYIRLDG